MAKSKYAEYVEPKLDLIQGWARNGLTIEQIAHNLGISKVTLYKHMEEHIELSERLKKGKEVIDLEVENKLLQRALGYKYTETTKEPVDGKMQVTKEVVKEVQPDTTAQIFWLKNRKPADWRDKKDIEHSGKIETPTSALDDEVLEERIKEMEKKLGLGSNNSG
jgi:transposase-like protein